MRKYLLIALSFTAVIFALVVVRAEGFWEHIAEVLALLLIICAPFLVFALISMGMAKAMRGKGENRGPLFQRAYRNLQLILSGAYLLLLLILFFHIWPSNKQPQTNYDTKNINMFTCLGTLPDTISKNYSMAYESLKKTVSTTAPYDTAVDLQSIKSEPSDTIINNLQMKNKVTFAFTIVANSEHYYQYTYYCNDSIGFEGHNAIEPIPDYDQWQKGFMDTATQNVLLKEIKHG